MTEACSIWFYLPLEKIIPIMNQNKYLPTSVWSFVFVRNRLDKYIFHKPRADHVFCASRCLQVVIPSSLAIAPSSPPPPPSPIPDPSMVMNVQLKRFIHIPHGAAEWNRFNFYTNTFVVFWSLGVKILMQLWFIYVNATTTTGVS